MPARKPCLFCDNPSDGKSKEDVLPVWIQKKMTGKKKLVVNGFSGERPVIEQGLKPSVKTGCVCGACNSDWLSRLEDETRKILGPLMEGINLMLDDSNKFLIAKWAVKTAMTMASLDCGKRGPFYTRDECLQFRRSFRFPAFTNVWIGQYRGAADGGVFGIEGWDKNPKHPEVTHFYITTLILGKVILQIFSVHTRKNISARRFSGQMYDGPWDQSLIALVPGGSAFWPPPLSFSDAGELSYQRLVYRFNVNARTFNPLNPDA